jgi:hypothetical protein
VVQSGAGFVKVGNDLHIYTPTAPSALPHSDFYFTKLKLDQHGSVYDFEEILSGI